MEFLNECPICKSINQTEFLKGKDYFLSQESFTITRCNNCEFLFTNPRPDEIEILKYYDSTEYLSHDQGNRSVVRTLYSWIRKYSIYQKIKLLEKFSHGKRILDIGCGTGEFLVSCKKHGWETFGIEPTLKARKFALDFHKLNVSENLNELVGKRYTFDVITMWHVIEHIHKLDEQLHRIHALLNPGGLMIIAVPNVDSWDATFYKEYWAAFDLPRHLYHFSPKTITRLCQSYNFNIEKIIPMKFDAFYISMLSEKYSRGRPNYLFAFLRGVRSNFYAHGKEGKHSSLVFLLRHQNIENNAL